MRRRLQIADWRLEIGDECRGLEDEGVLIYVNLV